MASGPSPIVLNLDCSQRQTAAKDQNLVLLVQYTASGEIIESLLDIHPLPVHVETECGDAMLQTLSDRLDELGVNDWRQRLCGITSDSAGNFTLTMLRAVRASFSDNVSMLPDPGHRVTHVVEDALVQSPPFAGICGLVANFRAWLGSDKRRRLTARVLQDFPEAGLFLPRAKTTPSSDDVLSFRPARLIAMPASHNIRWAEARRREILALWKLWPVVTLAALQMSLEAEKARKEWAFSPVDHEQADDLFRSLTNANLWEFCGFLNDFFGVA